MTDKPNGQISAPDPFDLASLRIDVTASGDVGVKKLLTTVPVKKPHKQEFVRVHPEEAYRISPIAMVELHPEREPYLVPQYMASELPGHYDLYTLYTAITRQGDLFLWPVKLPGEDGRQMDWHRSMAEAAERAINHWVRIRANIALGAYEIEQATGNLGEPAWPELSLPEIIRIAFRDHVIDSAAHAVIRRLRGEI